ncbi:hypothetical protein Pmani_008660 [Petrolisthes manimaculis]|uniref:Uncharacterized protein n=1 Tax=Petrolisthes manimaculis TaxID=1843537 RepID=A0AAE1UIQ3_9EUCA|nr:hypothetical protein Pmani_008660 [Petrolisthes manimaculis]
MNFMNRSRVDSLATLRRTGVGEDEDWWVQQHGSGGPLWFLLTRFLKDEYNFYLTSGPLNSVFHLASDFVKITVPPLLSYSEG